MEMITTQLVQEALANVNITIVVALMAVGFIIKHSKFLEKFSNDFIPPTLLLLSIVATIAMDGFTVQAIISAIINCAIAVGLHQNGKNIFTVSIIPTLANLFKSFTGNNQAEQIETEKDLSTDLDMFTESEPVEEYIDEVVEED